MTTKIISGGAGGLGGRYDGFGGYGVFLAAGGTVSNTGTISGGYGRHGGNGAKGVVAPGVELTNGGIVLNQGTILGADAVFVNTGTIVNGSAGERAALISGIVGVFGGAAATVINFGTIEGFLNGSSYRSVRFESPADRLIAKPGSKFVGSALGGGGTLEPGAEGDP